MTMKYAISTIIGAFIFPFLIRMIWGRLVDEFGAIGGWIAAGFLVGTTWTLNHGLNMIHQSGGAWIDMAYAASIGIIVCTKIQGGSIRKSLPTFTGVLVGGVLGGFILSTFLIL